MKIDQGITKKSKTAIYFFAVWLRGFFFFFLQFRETQVFLG